MTSEKRREWINSKTITAAFSAAAANGEPYEYTRQNRRPAQGARVVGKQPRHGSHAYAIDAE